ncbi:triose-phosphate isomerase [Streptococcus moroccensis]|uniref:Triosephosphate isomerase n=1 Tax=Streptococcus moroccensis TaxID=1451356 RepID=A0ABT9YSK1_9STRE|nr:triose-phosphate isomerase family protein [Streptococcus moroccensis]MDQ0222607.1 triosephosphate isomerase [Streptococcus moroccensis]
MIHIHLNLKRFDIQKEFGGVNGIAKPQVWGSKIVGYIERELKKIKEDYEDVEFTVYFPEAHLINAISTQMDIDILNIGCQSVYREDTSLKGNFGAFTTHRTANSMKQLGVASTIIGHLEERLDKKGVLSKAGIADFSSINSLFHEEIISAQKAGLSVLYCIGETLEERDIWQEVLENQLRIALEGVDLSNVVIAYEPVWAIGPGKTPPTSNQVKEVIDFIKNIYPELDVIYGGGLKMDNASDLAAIDTLDGGLIALTRFTGEIGFYPDEYIQIIKEFLSNKR